MNKIVVEYDPDNGLALSDNDSKKYVEGVIELVERGLHHTPHIVIGTGLLITLFRCAVAEGKIKHTEIEFLFNGKTIKIDKYGTCEEWPKGFGDAEIDAIETLLMCRHYTKKHN